MMRFLTDGKMVRSLLMILRLTCRLIRLNRRSVTLHFFGRCTKPLSGWLLFTDQARVVRFRLKRLGKPHFTHAKTKTKQRNCLKTMMRLPFESLHFVDLLKLQEFAPRVAERFWERAKGEGRKEFESGHLAANITFPVGYMKGLWNIARYLGVRESFIDDWNPQGGIEVALIDMMAQKLVSMAVLA